MARTPGDQPRDQSTRRSGGNAATSPGGNTNRGRSDQERSIQTNREQTSTRESGLTSRRRSAPGFGNSSNAPASPFTAMRRMAEDMERLFEVFGLGRSPFSAAPAFGPSSDLDRDLSRRTSSFAQSDWAPQIETFRRGDQLVVRADLPGVDRDDVDVEVDNGMLTISGERNDSNEEHRDGYYRTERTYGRFARSFTLPEGVSSNQVDATFKDGVLEVSIPVPKNSQEQNRRIPIR